MNMLDTKKCFRGVLLWREDVLKCATVVKKPLSEFVRELLHTEMTKHRLTPEGEGVLNKQILEAVEARKRRKATGRRNRVLMSDTVNIPAKVRRSPKFVKE